MTKIKVKFSFLVFNALIFMFRDAEFISAFYIACISHEMGHIIALKITGGELKSIEFSCSGIKMTASPYTSIKSGIFVLMSGVAVNFILYTLMRLCGISGYMPLFNMAEGLFNLLPYSMLDGGAVLNLIAEGNIYEQTMKSVFFAVRMITSFVILLILCYNVTEYFL